MRISAIDVKKQEFKKSFRGYEVSDVEAYLDTVANEIENLYRENESLKEQIAKLDEEKKDLQTEIDVFKDNEKTFQKAIVKSQDMAEDVVDNAKKRAELIVKEAEIISQKTKLQAHEDFVNLKHELEELRAKNEMIIDDIKNYLIEKLNSIEEYSRNRKIIKLESNLTSVQNEQEHDNTNKLTKLSQQDDPTPDFGMDLNIDESK